VNWLLFIMCALALLGSANERQTSVGGGIVAASAVAGMVAAVLIQWGRI